MKGSKNYPSQEEQDRLLFEYLEGVMAPGEEKMLEDQLQSDALLQDELASWKESYILQDFYATEALENRILVNTPKPLNSYFAGSVAVLVAVILASCFYFLEPKSRAGRRSEAVVQNEEVPAYGRSLTKEGVTVYTQAKSPDMPAAGRQQKYSGTLPVVPEITTLPAAAAKEELPEVEKRLPTASAIHLKHLALQVNVEEVKLKEDKDRAIFSISRKEQRNINRRKRKARENQMARELQKGKRSYVVPLNSQNF